MKTDGDDYRLLTPMTTQQRVKRMEIVIGIGKFTAGINTVVIGGIVIGGSQFFTGSKWLWLMGAVLILSAIALTANFAMVWFASILTDPDYKSDDKDLRIIVWTLGVGFVGTWVSLCALVLFVFVNLFG